MGQKLGSNNRIKWVLDPRRCSSLYLFRVFYKIQRKFYKYLYKTNTLRNPKITWVPLYKKKTEIPLNFSGNYENTPIARVAHARPLLEGWKSSARFPAKRVASGRSRREDSYDGGFDCRWWLTRENRRFEAFGGRRCRDLFPAR